MYRTGGVAALACLGWVGSVGWVGGADLDGPDRGAAVGDKGFRCSVCWGHGFRGQGNIEAGSRAAIAAFFPAGEEAADDLLWVLGAAFAQVENAAIVGGENVLKEGDFIRSRCWGCLPQNGMGPLRQPFTGILGQELWHGEHEG